MVVRRERRPEDDQDRQRQRRVRRADRRGGRKTIAGAKVDGQGDDLKLSIDYNTKEAGAYPIVLATYEIVCSKGLAADKLPLVKGLLGYAASTEGQAAMTELGYAPLPESVRTKVEAAVKNIS